MAHGRSRSLRARSTSRLPPARADGLSLGRLTGCFVGLWGLGICWTIGWQYFIRFQNDRKPYLVMASLMIATATVDSVIQCRLAWSNFVTFFADYAAIPRNTWEAASMTALMGASSLLLQSFLVFRIAAVSKMSHWLWRVYCAIAELLALVAGAIGFAVTVRAATLVDENNLALLTYMWSATSLMSELMSTGGLVYFLVVNTPAHQALTGCVDDRSDSIRSRRRLCRAWSVCHFRRRARARALRTPS